MKFARFDETGTAVETIKLPEGVQISDCFHPSLAVQFESVPDDFMEGMTRPSVQPPPDPAVT